MSQTEDTILTEALRCPETQRDAFERIVNLYSEQLYRQIRRMVYCHDDANDILQNTFIKAWINLDSYRGDARIATWLYRICINETLNFMQKKKETSRLDDASPSITSRLLADSFFDGDATALQLQEAISLLPEKQRVVFQLKYYEEMKYEEMSIILDTSVGALKASYHHAVKKICEYFKQLD
jgi:RNA polymerase sigma-70 factor (ECF subfamily)